MTQIKSSLLSMAKKVEPKAAKGKEKLTVIVPGQSANLLRIQELNSQKDDVEAELKMLTSTIKGIAKDEITKLYEKHQMRPESFILKSDDGDGQMMVIMMDKYLKLDEGKIALLQKWDGVLDTKTTYNLNAEIAERNGDAIVEALMGSDKISDKDKENLLEVSEERFVKKGTVDRLMQFTGWKELLSLIEPILALKNAGDRG